MQIEKLPPSPKQGCTLTGTLREDGESSSSQHNIRRIRRQDWNMLSQTEGGSKGFNSKVKIQVVMKMLQNKTILHPKQSKQCHTCKFQMLIGT